MIKPSFFVETLAKNEIEFFTGVPDSLLKNICAYITENSSKTNNIIAANEGGAIGLAAGYHLATGKIPVVYMQNSGEGNAVNPLMSLTDKDVYNIPVLLVIGWRGEPGVHDEPQHVKQGKVTCSMLETMGIRYEVLSLEEGEASKQISNAVTYMKETQEAYALVIRKGTFEDYKFHSEEKNCDLMSREKAIQIAAATIDDNAVIVSTTGMISRELFEYRTARGETHERDFLTVGSMGHASQIALGMALCEKRSIYCFDGDGASIMHMGNMAIVGSLCPENYIHIVFNNGAHDSVGGQPTVGLSIDLPAVARAVGYKNVCSVTDESEMRNSLLRAKRETGPTFIEVKVKKGARKDLGRPTTTPVQNKTALMSFLKRTR